MGDGVSEPLRVDPERAGQSGIFVRAIGPNGRWGSFDIARLDRRSIIAWLTSEDGLATRAVMCMLGYEVSE